MKELTYFYLSDCPYCHEANRLIEALIKENPEFQAVKISAHEERAEKKLADSYDYYYVPCFFLGKEKLHEGAATKEKMRAVLARGLEA